MSGTTRRRAGTASGTSGSRRRCARGAGAHTQWTCAGRRLARRVHRAALPGTNGRTRSRSLGPGTLKNGLSRNWAARTGSQRRSRGICRRSSGLDGLERRLIDGARAGLWHDDAGRRWAGSNCGGGRRSELGSGRGSLGRNHGRSDRRSLLRHRRGRRSARLRGSGRDHWHWRRRYGRNLHGRTQHGRTQHGRSRSRNDGRSHTRLGSNEPGRGWYWGGFGGWGRNHGGLGRDRRHCSGKRGGNRGGGSGMSGCLIALSDGAHYIARAGDVGQVDLGLDLVVVSAGSAGGSGRRRGRGARLKMDADFFRLKVFQRTGMGLLLGNPDFRQDVENGPAFNFQLAGQIVDSSLTHPPFRSSTVFPLRFHINLTKWVLLLAL